MSPIKKGEWDVSLALDLHSDLFCMAAISFLVHLRNRAVNVYIQPYKIVIMAG